MLRATLTTFAVMSFLMAVCGCSRNKPLLLAGASSVRITPEKSVYMAGLGENRLSEGVHDDIFVRCLVLKNGDETLILVSADLIGFLRDDVDLIRSEVEKLGLPPENVIIASTHLHSGPDTIGLWGPSESVSGVDEGYMRYLRAQMIRCIEDALSGMMPATIKFASTGVEGVAKNHVDPDIIDSELSIMKVDGLSGGTIAVIANYANHPEVLWSDNHLITADYVGYFYKAIEASLGGVAIFFNGALGGMVSPDVSGHTFEEAERVGTTIAAGAIEALRTAEVEDSPRISIRRKVIRFPVENDGFLALREAGVLKRDIQDSELESEIYAIDVGSAQIVTIPGELLPKLGLKIKEEMSGKYRFLICLANDELGYIIPEEEFGADKFNYERTMSLGPKTGTIILEKALELLKM